MRIRYILLLTITVAVAAGGGFYLNHTGIVKKYLPNLRKLIVPEKPSDSIGVERSTLEKNIHDRLKYLETPDSLIKVRASPKDGAVLISAPVPRGKPVEWIIWHLSTATAGTPYRVDDCFRPSNDRGCSLSFSAAGHDDSKNPPVKLTVQWAARYNTKSSKIAVLIKDFGFSADKTTIEYLSFPEPLTVSLVPSKKLAAWTARISKEYKKEIIVLLPMEPLSGKTGNYLSSTIMVHYPGEKLRRIIGNAMESLPEFAGFSNLSGARVLEDSRVMSIIFSELKKRHGYFIEEGVTRKTVVPVIAAKSAVPFAAIDFSVDSTMNTTQIQELLRQCAIESQKRGAVIICSRATDRFISTLKNELPMLRQNGIRLSYISDIVNPENRK